MAKASKKVAHGWGGCNSALAGGAYVQVCAELGRDCPAALWTVAAPWTVAAGVAIAPWMVAAGVAIAPWTVAAGWGACDDAKGGGACAHVCTELGMTTAPNGSAGVEAAGSTGVVAVNGGSTGIGADATGYACGPGGSNATLGWTSCPGSGLVMMDMVIGGSGGDSSDALP